MSMPVIVRIIHKAFLIIEFTFFDYIFSQVSIFYSLPPPPPPGGGGGMSAKDWEKKITVPAENIKERLNK